jgi:VanZ family protein
VAIGVLYTSALPLSVDFSVYCWDNGFGLANIAFHATTLEDIFVNLAAYAVIGSVTTWYLISRRPSLLRLASWTILPAAGLSLLVEMLQTGIDGRVASWWDVILNIAGASAGVVAALVVCPRLGAWLARVTRASYEHPFRTASALLGVSLFLYHLVPFDFVTSTSALHAGFRRAQLELIHAPGFETTASPFASQAQDMSAAAWFAIFAMLVGLSRRSRDVAPINALFSAIRQGVVLAGVIEVLQLFTASHVFELTAVVQRSAVVMLGAWFGVFAIDRYRLLRRLRETRHVVSIGVLVLLLLAQVLLLCGRVDPAQWAQHGQETARATVLPFELLWRAPFLVAFASAVPILITYGLLATTIALVLRRTHHTAAWPVGCFAASIVALLVAFAEAIPTAAPIDITEPLLATFAAFAAVELLRSVQTVKSQPLLA